MSFNANDRNQIDGCALSCSWQSWRRASAQQQEHSLPCRRLCSNLCSAFCRARDRRQRERVFSELSSLPPERFRKLCRTRSSPAFAMPTCRVVKPEQAVAEVQITFSEDWQGYVLDRRCNRAPRSQTGDQEIAAAATGAGRARPMLTIRKISVWQQETPDPGFFPGQPEPAGPGAEPDFALFNGFRTLASAADAGNSASESVAA